MSNINFNGSISVPHFFCALQEQEDVTPLAMMQIKLRLATRFSSTVVYMVYATYLRCASLNSLLGASPHINSPVHFLCSCSSKIVDDCPQSAAAPSKLTDLFSCWGINNCTTPWRHSSEGFRYLRRRERICKTYYPAYFYLGRILLRENRRYTHFQSYLSYIQLLHIQYLRVFTCYDIVLHLCHKHRVNWTPLKYKPLKDIKDAWPMYEWK